MNRCISLRRNRRRWFEVFVAILLLIGWGAASTPRFLELYPSGSDDAASAEPLFLSYPDSLGGRDLDSLLRAPDSPDAKFRSRRLTGSEWERELVVLLHSLAHGRFQGVAHRLPALARQRPSGPLKDCLRVNLGLVFFLTGQRELGLEAFEESVSQGGSYREGAYRNLIQIAMRERNWLTAGKWTDALLSEQPGNEFANLRKAYLLSRTGGSKALEEFLRIRSNPRDSLPLFQIAYGRFLFERGEWKDAARFYNSALEARPRDGQAWMEVGEIYHRLGLYHFAETCFLKAFQVGVRDPRIFDLYARVMMENELFFDSSYSRKIGIQYRWDRIADLLRKGLEMRKGERFVAQALYFIYGRTGRKKEAKDLRSRYWFHFNGPHPSEAPVLWPHGVYEPRLKIDYGLHAFPLVSGLRRNDFPLLEGYTQSDAAHGTTPP